MASYRIATVLRYIGINDVRVLNGGNNAWVSSGYELETKSNKKQPGNDFGGVIPGAVYGYAGTSSVTLEDYRNIDNTMRNAGEIKELWNSSKIDTNNHLIFMCGSGWRAAEVLTYANVMGFDDTSLYSDGWLGWSNDTSNPVETGEPK